MLLGALPLIQCDKGEELRGENRCSSCFFSIVLLVGSFIWTCSRYVDVSFKLVDNTLSSTSMIILPLMKLHPRGCSQSNSLHTDLNFR